jgi:hypothetical protein
MPRVTSLSTSGSRLRSPRDSTTSGYESRPQPPSAVAPTGVNPRVGAALLVVLRLHFRSSPCGPAITHRKLPRTSVQGTCRRACSIISIRTIAAAAIDRDPRAPAGAAIPTLCHHRLAVSCRSARSRPPAIASHARPAQAHQAPRPAHLTPRPARTTRRGLRPHRGSSRGSPGPRRHRRSRRHSRPSHQSDDQPQNPSPRRSRRRCPAWDPSIRC